MCLLLWKTSISNVQRSCFLGMKATGSRAPGSRLRSCPDDLILTITNGDLEICDWKMCWPECDPWRGERALHFSHRFGISDPSSEIPAILFIARVVIWHAEWSTFKEFISPKQTHASNSVRSLLLKFVVVGGGFSYRSGQWSLRWALGCAVTIKLASESMRVINNSTRPSFTGTDVFDIHCRLLRLARVDHCPYTLKHIIYTWP